MLHAMVRGWDFFIILEFIFATHAFLKAKI